MISPHDKKLKMLTEKVLSSLKALEKAHKSYGKTSKTFHISDTQGIKVCINSIERILVEALKRERQDKEDDRKEARKEARKRKGKPNADVSV